MLALALAGPAPLAAAEPLPILARIGPWPVASRLIGHADRLWLANSVKGVDHNSADLHSYHPASGTVRYEGHLFSQDAGRPAVDRGLLYWPFEDARASTGVGHFLVTDGERWQLGTIPTARIFHTHAMAAGPFGLVAATSAWRAGLQRSTDGGATWRQVYDHPTPEGQVTRIVRLVALDDRVLGQMIGRDLGRLLVLDGEQVAEVPGWPQDRPLLGLTRLGTHVYGAVAQAGGVAIWRTDGRVSAQVAGPRPGWRVVDLAAGTDGLFALTASDTAGALWHSGDGRRWERVHDLEGGRPHEVAVHGGTVYVGGAGDDGRGILWGGSAPVRPPRLGRAGRLDPWPATGSVDDWRAAGARLDRALADPASHRRPDGALVPLIRDLAGAEPPEDFFAARLFAPMPLEEISLIGGNARVPAAEHGRWLLLWGMSLAGRGRVPVELLGARWTTPTNRAEKYFQAPPAAMWAVAMVGQNDRATIDALIERLDRPGDPLWLKGDAVGALTAVTGAHFGYDATAWRRWWRAARPGWGE